MPVIEYTHTLSLTKLTGLTQCNFEPGPSSLSPSSLQPRAGVALDCWTTKWLQFFPRKYFRFFFEMDPKKFFSRDSIEKKVAVILFLKPRVKIMFETSSREMCFLGSTFKWALYSNVKEEFGSFWQQLGILESDLYRLRERERER